MAGVSRIVARGTQRDQVPMSGDPSLAQWDDVMNLPSGRSASEAEVVPALAAPVITLEDLVTNGPPIGLRVRVSVPLDPRRSVSPTSGFRTSLHGLKLGCAGSASFTIRRVVLGTQLPQRRDPGTQE